MASDIHLEPNPEYADGTPGSDTDPALLTSAIVAMRRAAPDAPVVVIPGDFLGHAFHPENDAATMEAIAREFDHAFPRAQFVIALGNEDSACADYRPERDSPFLRAVARAWEPLVNRHGAAPTFARTFAHDGSYTAVLPRKGLRAVVIDDVVWSWRSSNGCGVAGDPSGATFAALERALPAHGPGRAWVVTHIPPGIDAHSSVRLSRGLLAIPFLRPGESARFATLVGERSRGVAALVAGHSHKFAFRATSASDDAVPILLAPSIAPTFRSAPAFLTVRVNDAGGIASAEEWSLRDGGWAPRGGTATLGMGDVSAKSIHALERRLPDDPRLRDTLAALYDGGKRLEIPVDGWRGYWCANAQLTVDGYTRCASGGGIGFVTRRGLIALGILIVLMGGVAVAMRRLAIRWKRMRTT